MMGSSGQVYKARINLAHHHTVSVSMLSPYSISRSGAVGRGWSRSAKDDARDEFTVVHGLRDFYILLRLYDDFVSN